MGWEPADVNRSQISLSPRTLFQSLKRLSPRPPHLLEVHTDSHATLAPRAPLGTPFHMVGLHNCSNLFKQPFGSKKKEKHMTPTIIFKP